MAESLHTGDVQEVTVDLFRDNPNPMYIYDVETLQFLDVNQATVDTYGWSREELLRMSLLDIRPEEQREIVSVAARAPGPKVSFGPWRHRYKNGTERLVRVTLHDIYFNSRAARAITVIDITDSIRATESLRMSEAELRALTDRLPVALLYLDAQGKCRRANRAFKEWFDISSEELVDQDFEFFIHRGDGQQYEGEMRQAWTQASLGEAATFEKAILIHNRKRNIEATYTPDFDAAGNVRGVIILLHDITERRALEDQFRHAQKMEAVGRLAGGIAHDFNNILSVINGYSYLLKQELENKSRLEGMAVEIHRAGERAARLTQQLLAFSRKQISQPRIVRIDELVSEDETMLRRLMGNEIQIIVQQKAESAYVRIDPQRFSQVLLNLAVNARDAMPAGGILTIRTSANCREAIIAVEDTGSGMTEEVKEHLFEPFFTTKVEGKGTGLGLATAYGIIRDAGGSIAVKSVEGQGSIFTMTIPLAGNSEMQEATRLPEEHNHRGSETILLIEDDANIRFLLAHTLKTCGYSVMEAADGAEGLTIGRQLLPSIDAVVSDALMPKMNGQEVIAELRRLRPDLKAMLVSGHTDAGLEDLANKTHVAFLYKPVPPETLIAELRRLLDAAPVSQT